MHVHTQGPQHPQHVNFFTNSPQLAERIRKELERGQDDVEGKFDEREALQSGTCGSTESTTTEEMQQGQGNHKDHAQARSEVVSKNLTLWVLKKRS